MKCDLCDGEYHDKFVVRNYKWHGRIIVVEDVPALEGVTVAPESQDSIFKHHLTYLTTQLYLTWRVTLTPDKPRT